MRRLMKLFPGPSIARRLMGTLLLAYALVWVVLVLMGRAEMFAAEQGNFDLEMVSLGNAVARVLDGEPDATAAQAALRGMSIKVQSDAQVMHETLGFPTQYMAFQVHDAQGALVARGGSDSAALPVAGGADGFFDTAHGGERHRVFRRWSADRSRRIDILQSQATRQQSFAAMIFSQRTLVQVVVGLVLLLLPVGLAVHTGLRPLRQLSLDLAARKPSDLQPIGVLPVYRELIPVVLELNGTLGRLQALLLRERAFLADAAHELRTPLAVVAAQCDTLMRTQDAPQREAAARRLGSGLARAMRLVNQLLALARLEADVDDGAAAADLANLARDGLAMYAGEALSRNIELGYAGPDSLRVPSPGHAFESVVANLVANAVRYGREGGRVELTLARRGGEVNLVVRDDGPGIAPADREHVFQRFRRGAAAGATGSGLGLAIVKAAARQMGGRIELAAGLDGRGLAVSLTWRA
jgi:two-component system sensor histidine kinase QseC